MGRSVNCISQMYFSTVFVFGFMDRPQHLGQIPCHVSPIPSHTLTLQNYLTKTMRRSSFGHRLLRPFGTHENRRCMLKISSLDVIVKLQMTNCIQHLGTLPFDSAMVYHWSHTSAHFKSRQFPPHCADVDALRMQYVCWCTSLREIAKRGRNFTVVATVVSTGITRVGGDPYYPFCPTWD